MALVEINFNPSGRDLKWFGLILLIFFGLIGGLVFWVGEAVTVAGVLWITGGVIFTCYYLVRPIQLPMYRAWMCLFYPLGWVMSHVLFGFIFFILLTPIGLLMRLVGRDPMERSLKPQGGTYWKEHEQASAPSRYLRQF